MVAVAQLMGLLRALPQQQQRGRGSAGSGSVGNREGGAAQGVAPLATAMGHAYKAGRGEWPWLWRDERTASKERAS